MLGKLALHERLESMINILCYHEMSGRWDMEARGMFTHVLLIMILVYMLTIFSVATH